MSALVKAHIRVRPCNSLPLDCHLVITTPIPRLFLTIPWKSNSFKQISGRKYVAFSPPGGHRYRLRAFS
jgi:hypothetical protein